MWIDLFGSLSVPVLIETDGVKGVIKHFSTPNTEFADFNNGYCP